PPLGRRSTPGVIRNNSSGKKRGGGIQFRPDSRVFLRVEQVDGIRIGNFNIIERFIADLGPPPGTLLGGNDNYPVCPPGAVNGGSPCVFQHLDRFHVAGRNVVDLTLNSVYQDQGVGIEPRDPTDKYATGLSGRSAVD